MCCDLCTHQTLDCTIPFVPVWTRTFPVGSRYYGKCTRTPQHANLKLSALIQRPATYARPTGEGVCWIDRFSTYFWWDVDSPVLDKQKQWKQKKLFVTEWLGEIYILFFLKCLLLGLPCEECFYHLLFLAIFLRTELFPVFCIWYAKLSRQEPWVLYKS